MHAQTIMRAYTQDPFAHLLISATKVKPLEKLEGEDHTFNVVSNAPHT